MTARSWPTWALVLCTMAACGQASTSQLEPSLPRAPGRLLFVGNSLTYTNDLPRTLADMARSTGDTILVSAVAAPDFALVDHLRDGGASRAIALGGWSHVVLQQGPSSTPINRDSLIALTKLFAERIRAVGARPALYSVWPALENRATFARAIESYRLASESVDGLYLPVAAAWQRVLDGDATIPLYAADGLHPTPLGTYLAALVLYERIIGRDARLLGPRVVVNGVPIDVDVATVRLLQRTAHEVTQ